MKVLTCRRSALGCLMMRRYLRAAAGAESVVGVGVGDWTVRLDGDPTVFGGEAGEPAHAASRGSRTTSGFTTGKPTARHVPGGAL
jgi:hypothetical protein